MSIFEALLQHDHVPNFYRVENTRSAPKLEDVAAETRRVMQESGTLEQLKPGQSVCIAAGSREIANIALIVRTVCEVVREHGAEPFIIPAMGSHAGAQAEGQKKILADFGITEEYTGAPIRSSMETGGCMAALRRTAAGAYTAAVPLADILAHPAPESLLLPVDTLFAAHPALTLTPAQEKCCRNGASFTLRFAPGRYRLYAESGEFLALGEVRDGRMETVKSFFAI